jgi:acetyltransferase-like isoleucine patch superfamily enzyme
MHDPLLSKIEIKGCDFGKNVRIIEPSNLYRCSIDDDVFIGPFVEVQEGSHIGARTKIQSHTFVCELTSLGADCFVGHGVMFINDKFSAGKPANGDKTLWKPTVVSDRVYIGSNATILPVSICSDVVIGAGAVVTTDITEPGKYAGNPAQRLED